MARKSSIDDLPTEILTEVRAAIGRGDTIDEIVTVIRDRGGAASRSAVGRYTKNFAEIAKQQRLMQTTAEAFGREFGSSDDHQGRMMVQLMTGHVTRALMTVMGGEEEEVDTLALSRLAKAVKDATSASKIDIEREAKIREEEGKRARVLAADAAEKAVRAAGASSETINRIRSDILGIAA